MKNDTFALIAGACLLTSCSTSFPDIPSTRTAMLPFIALGHTPGWQLRLDNKSMRFRANYGQIDIKTPLPIAQPTNRGNRYEAGRLKVEVTFTACADRMSPHRYTEKVTVFADGIEFNGCGGMRLQPGSLGGTEWTIVSIGQMTLLEDEKAHLRFDNGYVSLRSGCGKAGGDFSQNGNVLSFGYLNQPHGRTCSTLQMANETKILGFLNAKLVIDYSPEGHLILLREDGNQALLKRVL